MAEQEIRIDKTAVRKLLAAGNGDAALLYLYLAAGGAPESAGQTLRLDQARQSAAENALRGLGLWAWSSERPLMPAEAPVYSEQDLARERTRNPEFSEMLGETQRRLGRMLSTEEEKILLSIYRYLGLAPEVISILVAYCLQRSQSRGMRAPSIRAIQKEAYYWAEIGINTLEQAAEYMQSRLQTQSGVNNIAQMLGISGRRLTAGEEKYIESWLDWGFGEEAIHLAYEKTCLQAGGLKWPYMNSILKSWHEQGFNTLRQIEQGDRPPQTRGAKKPGYGVQRHDDRLSDIERRAVREMLEGEK